VAPGGYAYHVLNRAVARLPLFRKEADFAAFERVLEEAWQRQPIRILAYCLMKNHFHLVLWPRADGELTAFMRWLTHTHTMRWHVAHGTVGQGHLYQGRFKSFPIQEDGHFLTVCRYVERNPVRPGVVAQAQDWRWGSLWRREYGSAEQKSLLADWPIPRPPHWPKHVNQALTARELEAVRRALSKGCPFGAASWRDRVATELGLAYTLRDRGRPKAKAKNELRPL
jgi:putative transposase